MTPQRIFLLSATAFLTQIGSTMVCAQPQIGFHQLPLAIAAASPAPASLPPDPPAPEPPEASSQEIPAPPWARDLNLSAAQRSQLKTLNQQARKDGEPLHQQLMAAEKQLRSLVAK